MSTTISPAPVTPPPRLGATPYAEGPETAQPESRWSVGLRWAGDATSIVLLIAVLWWLSYHDGGWERTALAKIGLLAVIAVPAAAAELRRMSTVVRVLIAMWALGLVASLLFAAERSGFAQPTITYALAPVVGLVTYRLWRRRWGPPAVAGLLLVSFGLYWYQSFMGWWGLAMFEGRQPEWRPLSWHNQSGTLMVAFGLFFAGVALVGRRIISLLFGLCASAALAGSWLAGSRGTTIILFLGLAVLAFVAIAARGWLTALWRVVSVAVASVLLVGGLLWFAELQTEAAVADPISTRDVAASHQFFRRFLHMDAAVGMFFDAPLTGQGVGSYRNMALPFTSPDSNLTSSAHNEYAEILGEGGLLLAVPFAGLTLLALVLGLRRLRGARRGLLRLDDEIEIDDLRWPVSLGAVGVTAALLVHQGADFDWAYPVIPVLLAIAVAVVGHDVVRTGKPTQGRNSAMLPVAVAVVLSALLIAGSFGVLWQNRSNAQQPDLSAAELARVPTAWDAGRASGVAFDLMRAGEYDDARWTLQRAVEWNPGYHPARVDLAIVDFAAGEISGRELVDVLLDGYFDFASSNEVAQALIEGGEHELARSVLNGLLEIYPRYEAWGIDVNRADTWYLLVRSAAEGDGCAAAQQQAADAHTAEGMNDPEHLEPIDQLVEAACQ